MVLSEEQRATIERNKTVALERRAKKTANLHAQAKAPADEASVCVIEDDGADPLTYDVEHRSSGRQGGTSMCKHSYSGLQGDLDSSAVVRNVKHVKTRQWRNDGATDLADCLGWCSRSCNSMEVLGAATGVNFIAGLKLAINRHGACSHFFLLGPWDC
jgi:hypothetical protein